MSNEISSFVSSVSVTEQRLLQQSGPGLVAGRLDPLVEFPGPGAADPAGAKLLEVPGPGAADPVGAKLLDGVATNPVGGMHVLWPADPASARLAWICCARHASAAFFDAYISEHQLFIAA